MEEEGVRVVVREFDPQKDGLGVEDVERRCEVGPIGKVSLYTDLLGDPICRVRNSPSFLMLVAVMGEEIVGLVRGCIKTVTCGQKISRNMGKSFHSNNYNNDLLQTSAKPVPVYTKLAYILGLRVSPSHRRMGIGLKLVQRIEEWFGEHGAEYAYMATENDNLASIHLFTDKCGYSKFRILSLLVNPVYAHRVKVCHQVTILKLSPYEAERLYRSSFSTTEFFPRDIDSVLNNKLSLGTYLALPRGYLKSEIWLGLGHFLVDPPESWAVLSIWNCKDVFTLEVKGASLVKRTLAMTIRIVDRALPWLRLPSIPDFFRPFGLYFLYGLGGEGPDVSRMVNSLCAFAHNFAKDRGCEVVATEVSSGDPLRLGIPHWKSLSWDEDLWCMKRLCEDYSDGSVGDWTKSPPGLSIFVDPREF